MNPARLALRTVLRGRPRAWGALLAVAGAACALGMPRPVLVLMLEPEALWISAAGTLLGMGMGAALRQVLPDQGPALPLAQAGPSLSSLCTLAVPVLGAMLLAALVPAILAARHDVALGLALIPAHQEG